ncbi:MAG: RsmE family RNA methyltransferase [Acidobacteriota bacterium]
MARRRFFVDEIRHGRAVIEGDDARHLSQVLRAEAGRRYEISDNRDVYLAEIEAVRKCEVSFQMLEKLPVEAPPVTLTVLVALTKFDRFEWAIEKLTELGAAAIVPIEAERSEKGLERAALKRLERWRKIARESSQQSRRARLPEIAGPQPLARALAGGGSNRYFLDEAGGAPLLAALPGERTNADEVKLAIGPEGGWTDSERELAGAHGWTPVSLGPLILRAETACAAAAGVVMSAWLV